MEAPEEDANSGPTGTNSLPLASSHSPSPLLAKSVVWPVFRVGGCDPFFSSKPPFPIEFSAVRQACSVTGSQKNEGHGQRKTSWTSE